jgi:hypothetical protein
MRFDKEIVATPGSISKPSRLFSEPSRLSQFYHNSASPNPVRDAVDSLLRRLSRKGDLTTCLEFLEFGLGLEGQQAIDRLNRVLGVNP